MPLRTTYDTQTCSVASALELIGGRWTLLIIRELMCGVHRFDAIQADLDIARNVLQTRLEHLIDHGVVERRRYQDHPTRYDYRLTEAGLALWPVVITLMQWGDRHRPPAAGQPPVLVVHRECGGAVDDHLCCAQCGARLGPREVWALPGPGAGPDHPLRRPRSDPPTASQIPQA